MKHARPEATIRPEMNQARSPSQQHRLSPFPPSVSFVAIRCTQIPAMAASAGGNGSIIVNTSVSALRTTFNLGRSCLYAASKAAAEMLMKYAAIEVSCKRNVVFNERILQSRRQRRIGNMLWHREATFLIQRKISGVCVWLRWLSFVLLQSSFCSRLTDSTRSPRNKTALSLRAANKHRCTLGMFRGRVVCSIFIVRRIDKAFCI